MLQKIYQCLMLLPSVNKNSNHTEVLQIVWIDISGCETVLFVI